MARLFNTIIVWDVYSYAETEEDAREAALANIAEGLKPSEQVARDVGNRPVRAAWTGEKPLVGAAVSDEDFERVKGKTTQEVWEMLNRKPESESKKK